MIASFNLICQNEEFFISQWFNYVIKLANKIHGQSEIVIVDGGSTDNTIDIIKAYPDSRIKLHHFPWQNNFSASRNFVKDQSKGTWIIWLDADEVLSDKIFSRINPLLRIGSNVKAYSFPKLHLVRDKNHVVDMEDNDPGIRIFRNSSEFKWEGSIENLYYKGVGVHQHPCHFNFPWQVYVEDIHLIHMSHLRPPQRLVEKYMKYSKMEGTQFYKMSSEEVIKMSNNMEVYAGSGVRDLPEDCTYYSEVI